MAFTLIENVLCHKFINLSLNSFTMQVRNKRIMPVPKLRYPSWHIHKQRVIHQDYITPENKEFIQEVIKDRNEVMFNATKLNIHNTSPLNADQEICGQWTPKSRRTGLIVKKIGEYPLFNKKGEKSLATLLQVIDNHVVQYIPPEEYKPKIKPERYSKRKLGCLLVGAETIDPSLVPKDYYGLFSKSGVPAKKHLCRFFVSPEAQLPPGTSLVASHYRVGDVIDIRGKTIDRGFQGVMKRWGFKGMPATHGVTKTHRRPGNIGGGGEKGRVWPGTKLPGHMGNSWRILRGVTILRINTKYNVLWVKGVAIPGPTNGICYIYDTLLPLKKFQSPPPFPTYFENGNEEEDILHESIHNFSTPSITFNE